MKEYLSEYVQHLRNSYADAFPDGTGYQAAEVKQFNVTWQDNDRYVKIILELPTHTKLGVRIDRKAHSFIAKGLTNFPTGTILKAKSWHHPARNYGRGNVADKDSYQHLAWNRI